MTKEELIILHRQRGKQELNIGDKVIVHSASDKPLYDGKVATIIEKGISGNEVYYGLYIEGVIVEKRSKPLMGAAGIIGTTSLLAPFFAEDLELVKEPTAEDNFDEKVRLGGVLARLKEKREELVKIKEKDPTIILFNAELLNELSPLVYPDKEVWGAISASCVNIIDVYIGAIDRDFEKVKAIFEKL